MSAVPETTEHLVQLAESKDPFARGHARSVALGAVTIARELGSDDSQIERVESAALLHDSGNLQVEAAVLINPGRLSPEEFSQIREHPTAGARLLRTFPDLEELAPFVESHHERWDGNGYPAGTKGTETPLIGRIIAVAECFDAMTSPRAHRTPFAPSRALLGLKTAARAQLDPDLVEAFVSGVEKLVPKSLLESDDGVLSLEQAVHQEKQQLKHAFTMISQAFLWMFYKLVGDATARATEGETNDFLKRHSVTIEIRRGRMRDFSPSRVSPEELAETYKLALARAYAGVAEMVGKPVARMYLDRAVRGLSEESRQVCQSYRLCAMVG